MTFKDKQEEVCTLQDVVRLFSDPDNDCALKNMRELADSLNINLSDIPDFLENYAEVYLSLSFFGKCQNDVTSGLGVFSDELRLIACAPCCNVDRSAARSIEHTAENLRHLHSEVAGILHKFKEQTTEMWQDISAERYQNLKRLIIDSHKKVATNLCAITVKLAAWESFSSAAGTNTMQDKVNFVVTCISLGLDRTRSCPA